MRRVAPGGALRRTVAVLAVAAAVPGGLAACTYGEPRQALELEHAFADDGSKLAIAAQRHLWQRPTGLAAFPAGGSPRITEQFVDVYVMDMGSREILYRHAIDPPGAQSMEALEARVLGWQGDDVYVKLLGCEPGFGVSYKGCNGERRQAYVYRISWNGAEAAYEPVPALRRYPYPDGAAGREGRPGERPYLSLGDGVWIHYGARGPREQLLKVNGHDLEQVPD